MLLLSSTLVLLLGGSAWASLDGGDNLLDTSVDPQWRTGDVPDLAVLVSGIDPADKVVERNVVPALLDVPGVASVDAVPATDSRVAVLAAFDGDGAEVLPRVEAALAELLPDAQLSLGGRAVADSVLLGRLNRALVTAVVPVLVLLSLLLAASFGVRVGLAAGGTVAAATLLGGVLGAQIAGSFDGSLGTTALPAVLVSTLVSTVLSLRLLDWFKHPIGADHADSIRRSIRHLFPEASLLIGGILLATVVMVVVGPGRNQAGVVAAGAVISTIVTFALLPAFLATMPAVIDEDEYRMFRLQLPDGRDLPAAVLIGLAVFLVSIGMFALRAPSPELLDESALPVGSSEARVESTLRGLGGDPTSAVLVTMSSTVSSASADVWAEQTSRASDVGWVATATGRFVDGLLTVEDENAARFIEDGQQLVLVTPSVPGRSVEAQALVRELADTLRVTDPTASMGGVPVDAANSTNQGGLQLVLLMATLAVAGGLAVQILVGDVRLAFLSIALRFVGSVAVVGLYSAITTAASGTELQAVTLLAAVAVGLSEIPVLRRVAGDTGLLRSSLATESGPTDDADQGRATPTVAFTGAAGEATLTTGSDPLSRAVRTEGRAALMGLLVTSLCGLGLLVSDLAMVRRIGVGIALCLLLELLVASWLLRPVVLGTRLQSLAASQAAASNRARREDDDDDLGWTRLAQSGRRLADPALDAGTGTDADSDPDADSSIEEERGAKPLVSAQSVDKRLANRPKTLAEVDKRNEDRPATLAEAEGRLETPRSNGGSLGTDGRGIGTDARRIGTDARRIGTDARRLGANSVDDDDADARWRIIVEQLLQAEFAFQTDPARACLEDVFVDGTAVFNELAEHNRRLRTADFRVVGDGPVVQRVHVVNNDSPVALTITVDHPERQLLDADDKVLGVRRFERRDGMIWLIRGEDGRYRIAEAIDLGTTDNENLPISPEPTAEADRTDAGTTDAGTTDAGTTDADTTDADTTDVDVLA